MIPGLMAFTLLFGSEDPLAPVGQARWHHRDLTRQACDEEGWGPAAADETSWATLGVDLYSYHPIWVAHGGPRRWAAARRLKQSLDKIHFDDLAGSDELEEIWRRLLGGTRIGLAEAGKHDDVAAARHLIGIGLHAVQDFYSHSNWIDAPPRRDTTWLETWPGAPVPDGLLTGGVHHSHESPSPSHGRVRLTPAALLRIPVLFVAPLIRRFPAPGRMPRGVRGSRSSGINLDSRWQAVQGAEQREQTDLDGGAAFDLAYALALRDSRHWLRLLAQQVPDAFWARVTSGQAADRWTAGFEREPLCDFLTAGQYPPFGSQDSGNWFLRITLDRRPRGWATLSQAGSSQRFRGRDLTFGPLDPDSPIHLTGLAPSTAVTALAFRRAPTPVARPLTTTRQADEIIMSSTGLE
ncbi:hypothetical protein [Kineosporia sp. NBRC 101731]|uniref:hypothetical protein n=1 Tax=Kineosporia sp. NBRC 101731 TaxID=3032199 RepID=UPI0024A1708D|nr:hypothetical protein [Kineosporia sp. NBRC 101731]GLY29090.1 hypothetical protein Kisp02_24550 [Kineosporia sp. NBRC 101731]